MSQLISGGRDAARHFEAVFGGQPDRVWSAPGRVNLIGEHTDYNDGLCLPFAVHFRSDCAVRTTSTGRLRIASAQRPGELVDVSMGTLAPATVSGWAAYVAGAVWVLPEQLDGVDVLVDSDIPPGAGLSSSAALACAALGALGQQVDLELAQRAQRSENEFVGVPCGLMDQVASTLSEAGHALLFDAQSLTTQSVPLDLGKLELLVLDTCAPHELGDGAYATRRSECHEAAQLLGVSTLREASDWAGLPSPQGKRARHVITEIARVSRAVELLRSKEVAAVGPVMTASHSSLRDDFEVTVPQLDVAVGTALSAGAIGARMTGAGFGGSIVALTNDAPAVAAAVEDAFAARGWAEPRWFIAQPAAGLCDLANA